MNNSYVSITTAVEGDPTPTVEQNEPAIFNDDFRIFSKTTPVGDGVNESTEWSFNLADDSNYQKFNTSIPLESAILNMILEPKNEHFFTDSVCIKDINGEPIPGFSFTREQFGWVSIGQACSISVDLLNNPYTSDQILKAIVDNQIGMLYEEDALVSFAELNLMQQEKQVIWITELKSLPRPRLVGGPWYAGVRIVVRDISGRFTIDQARVIGTWVELDAPAHGITNADGLCIFNYLIPANQEEVTFRVEGLMHDFHECEATADGIDPEIIIKMP
jgi:hypothetical protein